MAAGGISLQAILPGIDQCSIYYISTHGSYEIQKYNEGKVPLVTTVPGDMLVIETSNIGESCYFTNFKEIMEPLLNDRPRLLQYLSGNPPADDTPELRFMRTSALNSCHIYLPGRQIANRYLTLETGFREGVHPENEGMRQERARASPYKHMTFRRYDVGVKDPSLILEHVHRKLIEEIEGQHDPTSARANAWIKGEITETYQTMFQHIARSAAAGGAARASGLKILIFPSCGTIVPTQPKKGIIVDKQVIDIIIHLQSESDREWTNLLGGRSLKNVYELEDATYKGPRGVSHGDQCLGADKISPLLVPKHGLSSAAPVPFHMALRSAAPAAPAAPAAQAANENGMSAGRRKTRRVKQNSKRSYKPKKTRRTR
jgi:hypothetical protein